MMHKRQLVLQAAQVDRARTKRFADFLRRPGRALGSPADVEPDRERVRDCSAFYGAHQGRVIAGQRTAGVVKLVMAAVETPRRLKGENQLSKVVQDVTFTNGVQVIDTPAKRAA